MCMCVYVCVFIYICDVCGHYVCLCVSLFHKEAQGYPVTSVYKLGNQDLIKWPGSFSGKSFTPVFFQKIEILDNLHRILSK